MLGDVSPALAAHTAQRCCCSARSGGRGICRRGWHTVTGRTDLTSALVLCRGDVPWCCCQQASQGGRRSALAFRGCSGVRGLSCWQQEQGEGCRSKQPALPSAQRGGQIPPQDVFPNMMDLSRTKRAVQYGFEKCSGFGSAANPPAG